MEVFPVLSACSLFAGLTQDEIAAILPCLSARQAGFRRGQFLLRAGDEVRCSLVLSTKPKLLADAQGVFTGRKPVKTVERRVIERDSGCREYSPIEFTAADKAVFVPNRSRV